MERGKAARRGVIVTQLELDLADQRDVVRVIRLDRIGAQRYAKSADEVVARQQSRREEREGLSIMRRSKTERLSRHALGTLVIRETARGPRPLHVETCQLRSIAGALRVLQGSTFVERDVAIANLGFGHLRERRCVECSWPVRARDNPRRSNSERRDGDGHHQPLISFHLILIVHGPRIEPRGPRNESRVGCREIRERR